MRARTVISAAVGVLGLAGLGWFLWKGAEHERKFRVWLEEEISAATIDISGPGAWSVPYGPTCMIAHAQDVRVDLGDAMSVEAFCERDRLRGSARITDASGAVLEEQPLAPHSTDGSSVVLARFVPARAATLHVVVTAGEPRLEGRPVRMTARNELCGLELMPAGIYRTVGVGCGMVGVGAVIVWLTTLVRGTAARSSP